MNLEDLTVEIGCSGFLKGRVVSQTCLPFRHNRVLFSDKDAHFRGV